MFFLLAHQSWRCHRHHQHFQTTSSLKPNYIWNLHWVREQKFVKSVLHDQDGCHTHIWKKNFEKLLLRNWMADDLETWYAALVTRPTCINFVQMMTLDLPWSILWQDQIWSLRHFYGKWQNSGFFWFYCSLWQSWFMQSAKWTFINTKGQGHLLTFFLHALVRFSIFKFSSKTVWLIEMELHVEPWMKVCAWDLGHITKTVTMPKYGKSPFKVFFSGLKSRWPLNLACCNGDRPYEVCPNDDPWLTLAYFKSRSNWVT